MYRSRDSRIDWTAPVTFIRIDRAADGSPIRDVLNSVWTSSNGCLAEQGGTRCEGHNEPIALWTERLVRRSRNFRGQPERISFEIRGNLVTHVPDRLLDRADELDVRMEVKGYAAFRVSPWLPAKLHAIERAYAQAGHRYELVTAADLNQHPLRANVDEIRSARRVPYDAIAERIVMEALPPSGATIGELRRALSNGNLRWLYAMHVCGLLTIDLVSGPLSGGSRVLPGSVDLGPYVKRAQ